VLEADGLQIVGAVDPSLTPNQDLGTVLGLPKKLKIKVETDPAKALPKAKADVALLCTSSSLREVKAQILTLVGRGIHVISTCEELAFATPDTSAIFKELDRAAAKKKVTVLGTGVNPGYAMDALALTLTGACSKVERVAVTRVVDAGTRRLPLQRKIGAGLALPQFRRALTEKTVRHVGLLESVHMIASGLGWKLDRVEETIDAMVAPRDMDTEFLRVPAGAAAGIRQHARGWRNKEIAISLDLQMYVGAENPRDQVVIDGTPRLEMTMTGGIPGDAATAALVVNAIPRVLGATAGLATMKDLPLVHALNPQDVRDRPKKK
jgi:4-hydroxy-tetrahydrodipicolinate reductase